jgi:hypothetical protein
MQIIEVTPTPTKFTLSEDFLSPYRKKGDPFKSLLARSTFLTKYSRGNSETWTDTVRRVIEGNVSLTSGVALQEAELLFHLFWTGQALPPGRGLWTGGVEGIPADARYNCFSSETKFFANGVLTTLGEAQGQTVEVLAKDGQWRSAQVKSFGQQSLSTILLRPSESSEYRLSYTATANHRWITSNRGEVTDLSVGDRILITPRPSSYGASYDKGFAHGFEFKMGALPSDLEGLDYLTGFLAGLMASAGWDSYAAPGDTVISDWIAERAPLLGFCVIDRVVDLLTFTDQPVEYAVVAVADTGRTEEVFCVVEPETHSFTLAGGVVTGNCWYTTLRNVDDWCWTANQLMLGGGVGVGLGDIGEMPVVPSRPSKFAVWCDSSHENIDDVKPEGPLFLNGSTPTYHVADSREGWVEALRLTMMSAYKGEDFIADVSGVRPRGRPIKTFGGIACGPGPLAKLLRSTSDIIRGAAGRRLNSVECLDITNHIGLCIKSGNVRRSALIVLGSASDQDFRDAKKDQGAVISHRHTSNNSIVFRTWEEIAGFDWHSLVEDNIDFGEPGILNMPLIWQTDPGARGVNPCFAGDTLIAVADGRNAVSIKQLADEGQDVPVYSMDKATGKVEIKTARNPRVTGYRKSLVRVWLDDGGYVDTTPDHKFLLRDGTPIEAAALKPGMSLPRFTKALEPVKVGSKDYYRIYCDTRHPNRDKLFEHRLIAKFHDSKEWARVYSECKHNGFANTGGLVVHHKDYDQLNNSPDNLQIMSFQAHSKLHGELDQAGDQNGRWSGFSNDELKAHGLALTQSLGHKFGATAWAEYAKNKGLPQQFSKARVKDLGTVEGFAQLCAIELGLEYADEDPRVLATYQAMLRQGYSCSISGGKVLVSKTCEGCRSDFQVEHAYRERSFCSNTCGNTHVNTSPAVKARRIAGMDATYSTKATVVKTEQARLYSELKYNLGRSPNRREWSLFCKKEGVPSRIGPTLKHGFRSFQDVAVAGGSYNHKVVRVEQLEGEHTVYNLTVDDFHTVSVVTSNREKRGKVSYTGVYVMQCGEQALHDREACNLAEVFPAKFEAGLDPSVAFRLVTRYSLRQRLTPLMDPQSHAIGQENMRIGVGLGGFCDFNWTPTMLAGWFADCRKEADSYADELGVNRPLTVTTVKPSGCRPWCALTSTNKGLLTLEELFQEHPAGQEWAAMGEGYYALQGASQSRITKTYNNGLAPVYRIRLSCGLEVESTGNHQWFCKGHHDRTMAEDPRWVRADRLRLGDVLDVKLGVYTAERKAPLQVVKGSHLKMRGESDNILQPEQMTPDLAWLVGYLWGTPVSSDLKLRFEGESSRWRLDKLQRVLDTYFGVRPVPESGLGSALILRLESSTILSWLTLNGLLKFCSDSPGLIPSVIRASGQEEIIAFISGMSDASSAIKGSYLTILTDDSTFTRHLQSVCWAVGLGGALSTDGRSLTLKPDLVTNRAWAFLNAHTVVIEEDLRDILVELGGELEDGLGDDREACQTAGKVEGLELLGEMPTYDIEVEDTHWYYAGCVKSHNTISLLNGSSPGVHAPHAAYYIRRTRIAKNDPMAQAMVDAGVPHVDDVYDTTGRTWAFEFPMKSANATVTSKNESVRSQFERQATIQKWWADNAVSATLNFDKVTEREELAACLKEFVPQLKSTSCLPKAHGYAQAPYEEIDEETYRRLSSKIDNDHKLTNAGGMDTLQGLDECAGGVCPVR